ncbi:hypothetical protein DFH94DRAFT_777227 [Russula ochroleuca]|uniref:Coenzyme Q-binding protein COQ10 START domain-containing protein n=1 Tax=Russula ochroleuca TaxID=152965 RepID=A0A9P5MQS4_9AGAM|nr:hypothetical protein DFH94DRAFT_777227 [Russula ochroleuca]
MTEYDLPHPELTTSSVFTIRSSISIDAPKERVWDVLLDFASYKEWNPYIRTQEIVSDLDKTPLLSQTAAPGRRIRLRLHVPPTMNDASTKGSTAEEILTHVDGVSFRLAWRFATPARWLINAERWQILRNGGPGDQRTVYETWEYLGGLLAYVIRFFMRTKLQDSFDAMSHALKERAERVD